jgi:hypothetical protein
MDRWIERLRDGARLVLIVGVAALNLGLAACGSSARVPVDGGAREAGSPDAARRDQGAGDGAADAQRADGARGDMAPVDTSTPPPDGKLWDVLCE